MANKFSNFTFTNEGLAVIADALANNTSLSIEQVYTFTTKLTDTVVYSQLSGLSPKQIKPVGTVTAHDTTVETRVQIDNSDVTTGYNLQGVALVGTHNSVKFVIGYINANETTNIPVYDGVQSQTLSFDVSFAISDTSVVEVNVQTAGMLTVADYNALIAYVDSKTAPLATDTSVVHKTQNETIDGIKTFLKTIDGSVNGNSNSTDYINQHVISANIDLNTLTTNGNYLSTLTTKTTTNKPAGTSEQYTLASIGNVQFFNDMANDKLYLRNKITATTFTSWKQVAQLTDFGITNAVSASKLATPRKLKVNLASTADQTFDGSADQVGIGVSGLLPVNYGGTGRTDGLVNALSTRLATFTDFATVAGNMLTYAGNWKVGNTQLTNAPSGISGYYIIEVIPFASADAGLIRITMLGSETTYVVTVNSSALGTWYSVAKDGKVVHNTGDETVAGTKTFTAGVYTNGGLFSKGVEVAGAIPFVDFHYANDTGDYTSRIIENTKGQLSFLTTSYAKMKIFANLEGTADVANKLATARSIQTNLSSNNTTNFDGTADITPGVTGVLSTSNGGTGRTDGLAKPLTTAIANNTDLNTLATAGQYSLGMNTGITNYPSDTTGSYFSLTVRVGGSGNGNNLFQEYVDTNTGNVYQRAGSLPGATLVWSNWKKVSDDSTVVHNTGAETVAGVKTFSSPIIGSLTGNSDTATKLATARTIAVTGDVTGSGTFDGSGNLSIATTESATTRTNTTSTQAGTDGATVTMIDGVTTNSAGEVTGVNTKTLTLPPTQTTVTGNAGSATKLATARTIGGVSFDGTANINLPGVNTAGNQSTSGNAGSATKLQTARTINGVAFDGTANISVNAANDASLVHTTGNETIAGTKTFSDRPVVTGLYVSNGTNQSDIISINASIPNQSDNNVPIGLNTGSTLVLGGGEAANSYLTAMAAGAVPIGNPDGAAEQLVLAGDAAVYVGAGYQDGGTTGKWWAFNTDGTVTAPSGNQMQEVKDGSIKIYGLGTYFTTDTYLMLTYSGKVVSIQGDLKTTVDMSGGVSLGEILIPSGYRPVAMRTKQVGFNPSSASTKVFADIYLSSSGMISIDNIVNGANMTAWGTIPAGSTLNISDTWVIA